MYSIREMRDLAWQRIRILLRLADSMVKRDEALARRYVKLAFRIAAKARLRLPRTLKRRYCRRCGIPLVPGLTARVRVKGGRGGRVIVTCLRCGYVRRYPLKKADSLNKC
ncbi:MAG: ribonuclease P [Thermoprotei archaeon]|nr:MAG: ribonuclease P [Thermoprotei archaeon]